MHHPLVDDITLADVRLELPADPGLALVSYSAEPALASEAAPGRSAIVISTSGPPPACSRTRRRRRQTEHIDPPMGSSNASSERR
jgi:hypothetical protein